MLPINTRVKIKGFDMTGVYLGEKIIKVTAKNYCDGFSEIKLADKTKYLFSWDENKSKIVQNDLDIFDNLEIVACND